MVNIYEIIEVLDEECFQEKPGFWLFDDNPTEELDIEVGEIGTQSFLKDGECVKGFSAKLIASIDGYTTEDIKRAFAKSSEDGIEWLKKHGVERSKQ